MVLNRRFGTRLLTLLVAAAPLAAQGVNAQVSGKVISTTGEAVAEARVLIRNMENGFLRATVTDKEGRFVALAMPVGPYTLTFEKKGFQTLTNVRTNLNLGDASPLRIRMAPEAGAVVEVTGQSTGVDSERTSTATLLTTENMATLPTNGRRWENFAQLTPQVTISSRGDLAIAGQRGVNTSIAVDGGTYSSSFFGGTLGSEAGGTPFTLSVEAIREFQVVTDGASTEFGRMGGGYLNAITKSGTNDLSGSVFYYDRPQSMVAIRHFDNKPIADFTQRQFGFTVGGPILKDRLFYFVSLDSQRYTSPNNVNFAASALAASPLDPTKTPDKSFLNRAQAYNTTKDSNTFLARFDWNITTDHTLQLRINRSSFTGDNGAGYNVAYDSTSKEEGKTLSIVSQWNWMISPNLISEFSINSLREELPRTRRSETPQVSVTNVGRYGESLFNRAFDMKQTQFSEKLTYVMPTWSVKAGVDYISHNIFETFTPRAGGIYEFNDLANFRAGTWNRYQQWFSLQPGVSAEAAGTMDETEKEMSAFIWAETKVTPELKVAGGLRWDRQEHPGFGTADFTANPTAYPSMGPLTGKIPSDSTISPRVSLTYTPEADNGRTVVRASVGSYVSRTPSVFMYQVLTSNGQRAGLVSFSSASLTPAMQAAYPLFVRGASFNYENPFQFDAYNATTFPAASKPDLQTFSPDFKNPRTTRTSLGAERTFLPGLTLEFKASWASTRNLERITDLNLPASVVPNAQGRPVYTGARPNTNFNTMQVYVSDAKSDYQAYTFGAKYAPEGSFITGSVNYTYAKEKDNDSNERSFSGYGTQDPNRLGDDYAYSDNDRRHVLTGYVNFFDKWYTHINVGLSFRAQTGSPYTPLFSNDQNGDSQRNDRIWGSERNGFRTPKTAFMDLKLSYDLKLYQKLKATFSAEVFNLFNRKFTYDRYRLSGTDAAPVWATAQNAVSTERQVQVGARFSF